MAPNYTKEQIDELAMTYSALILHDENIPITAEKLDTLSKAAGIDVEAYWPMVFAKFLSSRDVSEMLRNVGGAAAPAGGAVAAEGGAEAEAAEEPKKEETEEESDDDMGMDLFG